MTDVEYNFVIYLNCVLQSMKNSKIVEISSDQTLMRARDEPSKWSLKGMEATNFSSLSVDVPEFVPGKPFKLTTTVTGEQTTGETIEALHGTDSVDNSLSPTTASSDSQTLVLDARTSALEDKSGRISSYQTF